MAGIHVFHGFHGFSPNCENLSYIVGVVKRRRRVQARIFPNVFCGLLHTMYRPRLHVNVRLLLVSKDGFVSPKVRILPSSKFTFGAVCEMFAEVQSTKISPLEVYPLYATCTCIYMYIHVLLLCTCTCIYLNNYSHPVWRPWWLTSSAGLHVY